MTGISAGKSAEYFSTCEHCSWAPSVADLYRIIGAPPIQCSTSMWPIHPKGTKVICRWLSPHGCLVSTRESKWHCTWHSERLPQALISFWWPWKDQKISRTGLTAPEKDQAAGHCLNVSSLICAEQCCATAMSVPPIGRWLGKRIRSPGNPWQGPPSSGCPWDKGTSLILSSLPGLICPPIIRHWLLASCVFCLL